MKAGIRNHHRLALMALVLATLFACNDLERPSLLPYLLAPGANRIGVVSSDLGSAGRFSTMTLEGIPQLASVNIHSDAVARCRDGRIVVVNRLNRDNIQILNPNAFFAVEREFSVGAGTNPHDYAPVSANKAFVTLYERGELLIVDPLTGLPTGAVNLAAYADADGIPEMSGLHLENGRLFVALQRLDRNNVVLTFPPTDYSTLLEIDVTTNTVLAEHRPDATNPFGRLRRVEVFGQPHLILVTPGGFGPSYPANGGVQLFNLSLRTFRPGFIYSEVEAGGDILDVIIKNDTTAYATVLFADAGSAVVRFDPSTGRTVSRLVFFPGTAGGFNSGMTLAPDGRLFISDTSFTSPGVLIFDTNQGDRRLTPLPVSVGLRPTDLIYIP